MVNWLILVVGFGGAYPGGIDPREAARLGARLGARTGRLSSERLRLHPVGQALNSAFTLSHAAGAVPRRRSFFR